MGALQKKSTGLTWLRGGLVALAVTALALAAWREGPRLAALQLHAGFLALATLFVLVAFAGQVWAWQWNLERLGGRVSYRDLFRVYYIMNLARYVPGKIWSVAGSVALGKRLGVQAGMMSASLFLGLGSSLVSGVLVGFVAAYGFDFDRLLNPALLTLPALALALVFPPVFRLWSRPLLRRFVPGDSPPELNVILLARSVAHFALVWLAYGAACGALALAVGLPQFALYFAAFPLAYVAGLAALVAPGGLGVREGALVWLCGGGAPALAVSLLQRFLLSVLELVLFAISVWSFRHD